MRAKAKHYRIQRQQVIWREQEVEIFQSPREPDAFHLVHLLWGQDIDVGETYEAGPVFGGGVVDEGGEHFPAPFAVGGVASDAPHVKEAFYCFGTLEVLGFAAVDGDVGAPSVFTRVFKCAGIIDGCRRDCFTFSRTVDLVDCHLYRLWSKSTCGDFVHGPTCLH